MAYLSAYPPKNTAPKALEITGQQTGPQIFINGQHIGDAEALEKWACKAA